MPMLDFKVQKGLKIFIALVVLTLLTLLILTASRETIQALKKMNLLYLILALCFWGVYLVLDAFRISLLTQGVTGNWGSLKTGFEVLLTGAFLAAVTPFQTGGLPVQLYILKKRDNIPWGKGTLIILLRGVFFGIMMVTLLPFLLPIINRESNVTSIRLLTRYSLIVYSLFIGFVAFVLIKPSIIKRFIYRLTMKRGKRGKATKWAFKIFKEVQEMRDGFWHFSVKKKWHSIASFFLTFFAYIPYYFIAPLLLKSVGVEVSFFKAAFLQLVVALFCFFCPTPGATGVSEGGFALLFSGVVAKHLLGVFTILWRFFTFYIAAIIGGFMTLKVLRLGEKSFEEN